MEEAETHYREAVAILKQEMGDDYLDLPGFLSALASSWPRKVKLAESREFAEEAVDICHRHPDEIERWQQDRAAAALHEVLTKLGDVFTDANGPTAQDPESRENWMRLKIADCLGDILVQRLSTENARRVIRCCPFSPIATEMARGQMTCWSRSQAIWDPTAPESRLGRATTVYPFDECARS